MLPNPKHPRTADFIFERKGVYKMFDLKTISGRKSADNQTVSQGEVSLDEIAAEACRRSGISEGAVVTVVTDLKDILKQRLSEGQTVVLSGIGRFSLRVESVGVDDPKAFDIRRHITRIVCGFLPSGRRTHGRHILYDVCDGVKAVWQKGSKP